MYATCLFCNGALGANTVLEHFPVGRRIAYDKAKGRLWVVCRTCERWNLSPLETRFEAIEEAEQTFRATRMKVVSENIGMAQLGDGLELVRIGRAQRPEFAAWRYGDQFGRRRRKARLLMSPVLGLSALGCGLAGANLLGTVAFPELKAALAGLASIGPYLSMAGSAAGIGYLRHWGQTNKIPRMRVRGPNHELLRVTNGNAASARLFPASRNTDWHLTLPNVSVQPATGWLKTLGHREMELHQQAPLTLTGDVALRALGTIMPSVNVLGGDARAVQHAVNSINAATDVQQLLRHGGFPDQRLERQINLIENRNKLSVLQPHFRLALEMALHESDERRAMEGELKELELRWRDADAIAKIADEMFLPSGVDGSFDEHRKHTSTR
ncbi:MAG: hypothetical protein ABI120_26200 [Gemmatimonadaceae bacterium]